MYTISVWYNNGVSMVAPDLGVFEALREAIDILETTKSGVSLMICENEEGETLFKIVGGKL